MKISRDPSIHPLDHLKSGGEEITPITTMNCKNGYSGTVDHSAPQDYANKRQEPSRTGLQEQLDQPTPECQEMQQSQNILSVGQRVQTLIEIAPVSSEDCRDILDLNFANLPSPVSATMDPPVANKFPGDEGEVPPSFPLPLDLPLECTPSRKRPKEPSGDSSINSPDQKVWPDPLSISSPLLDPQCLSAFSITTQMNSGVEETEGNPRTQKKKKKKGKSPHWLEL